MTGPSADPPRRRPYWERSHRGGVPHGADLAALRSGIGREAGSVPAMWPFYTALNPRGRLSATLRAEHLTLTLFAVHQQSRPDLVHREGTGLGGAARQLHATGASPAAVDRRLAAAATATSLDEAAHHLRGLVRLLRHLPDGGSLDYTRLWRDLTALQFPDGAVRVRRVWGSDYFLDSGSGGGDSSADPAG